MGPQTSTTSQAAEPACCAACASPPAAPAPAPALITLERDRKPAISRTLDRRITVAGLFVTALFLVAAVGAVALPEPARRGLWLPVHLILAGAAGTAIASVLPFFVAALAVVQPGSPRVRGAAIALIASGALFASLGVTGNATPVAVAGALVYMAGLVAVAGAAFWPLRGGKTHRLRLVRFAYAAAICQVVVGVGIVGLMLAGFAPIGERWALVKPAHAWLNVFGFLSLTVAATLVHLAPTVVGGRIVPRLSASIAVVGLTFGPAAVALGFALGSDNLARIGAALEVVGATALALHALVVWRDRPGWTTDAEWHRVSSWSLTAAPLWLLVAVVLAAAGILTSGATPAAWSLTVIAAPLAVGFVAQAVIGSWTHLMPAIGPGDAPAHRRQRDRLGLAGTGRLAALNLGVVLVAMGAASATTAMTLAGTALIGATIVASAAIFMSAFRLPSAPGFISPTTAANHAP